MKHGDTKDIGAGLTVELTKVDRHHFYTVARSAFCLGYAELNKCSGEWYFEGEDVEMFAEELIAIGEFCRELQRGAGND